MECLRSLSPLPPSFSSRLIIGIPQLLLSIASLLANLLLLITLLHSSPLHFSFQLHVMSLIVSSLGFISIALFVFTPIVLFNVDIQDPLLIILSTPDSLFYQAMMFITTVIAVERCSLFLSPSFHQFLSGPFQYFFLSLPWIGAIFIVSHSTYTGCYKRVDPYALRFTYACSSCGVYSDLLFYSSFAFPLIIATSYAILFIFLFLQNFKSQEANITVLSNRQQLSFAVQFSIIAILQLFGSSFFYILPRLFGGSDVVNSLLTSSSTLNSMANPICMFIFQV